MIQAPSTYAEWVVVLKKLKEKENDKEVLEAMKKGQLVWQPGVAQRFTQKLLEAIKARMNAAVDKFSLEIGRSNNQEGPVVQCLIALRREMQFLLDVVDLPCIPDDRKKDIRDAVIQQVNTMQNSIEDSARGDRSGRTLSIVRNHKINNIG